MKYQTHKISDYKALVFDETKALVNIVYWCNTTLKDAQNNANNLFFPMYLLNEKTNKYTWKIKKIT